jgi:hypothetical protein
MDLAIRVNVRYAAPPNSQIKDALRLFKSPRWVQSIIRYIMPQLNSVSPAAVSLVENLKSNLVEPRQATGDCDASCVVCMENMNKPCVQLPCQHQFHESCIEPWLKMHSTCPTCRYQLPTDAYTNYSVYAINTTIILQQSQARMPTAELLELPASNQIIRAIVNARVRRNVPVDQQNNNEHLGESQSVTSANSIDTFEGLVESSPLMNASVLQRSESGEILPHAVASSRRRCRSDMEASSQSSSMNKRSRLEETCEEQSISASV